VSSPVARSEDPSRFGVAAPPLLRTVAIVGFLALVSRLVSEALPGSRSGISDWIRRMDSVSSFLVQLGVLLGSSLLVLLVVGTIAERRLHYAYRVAVVPIAAIVLMLVMLASTMGLEPEGSLTLGVACLAVATAGSSMALRTAESRGQGLVISLATLGIASRLAARVVAISALRHDPSSGTKVVWLASIGHGFDAICIAIAAARFRSERRDPAGLAIVTLLLVTCGIAWGALRGSLEGAQTWQVIAARAGGELISSPVAFSTLASRYSVEILSVLFGGTIAFWPGRISAGMMSAAIVILARPGADVPAAALLLTVGALAAPLAGPGTVVIENFTTPSESPAPRRPIGEGSRP
jgi:hypothetical protein